MNFMVIPFLKFYSFFEHVVLRFQQTKFHIGLSNNDGGSQNHIMITKDCIIYSSSHGVEVYAIIIHVALLAIYYVLIGIL